MLFFLLNTLEMIIFRPNLRRHDSLPLSYQFTFETLAVPPVAEALVALQVRHVSVVPAAGALGHPRGFVAFRRSRAALRHLLALLVLAHGC